MAVLPQIRAEYVLQICMFEKHTIYIRSMDLPKINAASKLWTFCYPGKRPGMLEKLCNYLALNCLENSSQDLFQWLRPRLFGSHEWPFGRAFQKQTSSPKNAMHKKRNIYIYICIYFFIFPESVAKGSF